MNLQKRPAFNEANFGYKVRAALNESLDNLPVDTSERLAAARKLALARKKQESKVFAPVFVTRLAGALSPSSMFNQRLSWLGRMGMALPVLVLVVGLVGMYHYEEQQRINETADIDALVLSDELPLSAYLDHGFSAYLNKHGE